MRFRYLKSRIPRDSINNRPKVNYDVEEGMMKSIKELKVISIAFPFLELNTDFAANQSLAGSLHKGNILWDGGAVYSVNKVKYEFS